MTTHAATALVGAGAFIATASECLRWDCPRWKWRFVMAGTTLLSFIVLAALPCPPLSQQAHKHEEPALERNDIDHTEKLMLAHYRRVRTERELANAWPK